MKTLKAVVGVLSLIIIPVLVESCCGVLAGNGSCPCNPDWSDSFDINSMSMKTSNDVYGGMMAPSSHTATKFFFVTKFDATYFKAEAQPRQFFEFTGGSRAYACDPPLPVGRQKIKSLNVTSNADFTTADKTFAAGTDLTELFLVDLMEVTKLKDVVDLTLTRDFIPARLSVNVDVEQRHNFKFVFALDNGQTYELQSGTYELLPE